MLTFFTISHSLRWHFPQRSSHKPGSPERPGPCGFAVKKSSCPLRGRGIFFRKALPVLPGFLGELLRKSHPRL
jgi:hypothetical protein